LQAWQILIGAASNRQTLTYKKLALLMYGKNAAGVLAQVLGHIAAWCVERDLPELNSLVVGVRRGSPGHGIPLDAGVTADVEREKVYAVNWYDIRPPLEGSRLNQSQNASAVTSATPDRKLAASLS
jgi:hypothetical protein